MIMPGAEPFELGPEEARIGCVLIHGFTGSPAEMKPFARRLSAAGVRCYAPLLPGHGTSLDDMEASTAHQWLDGAEQAVRTVIGASAVAGASHRPRHERLFVLGFSMGGLLTLNLSLNPDLAPHITGLVVVCTPCASMTRGRGSSPSSDSSGATSPPYRHLRSRPKRSLSGLSSRMPRNRWRASGSSCAS